MPEPSVVLVSVPGLLADDLLPLADSPALRVLGEMIERGALGLVRAPVSSNVTQHLWTLATGQPPDIHGVPGPYAVMPEQLGIYPIGRCDARVPPLWELSAAQGLKSCCIAWPGTRDTSARDVFVVTDDIHTALAISRTGWPLLPGTTNERDIEAELIALRVHPSEVLRHDIDFFIERTPDPVLRDAIARAIAAAATVQAVLLQVIHTRAWRVVAAHFDWLDRIRRLSGRTGPMARTVIARGYRFLDLLVANLRRALPANTTLFLASPPARRGPDHTAPGVLIVKGPGIEPDVLLGDIDLTDVAPAVLHAAGAAIPRGLPGQPPSRAWRHFDPPRQHEMPSSGANVRDNWALSEVRRLGLHATAPLASYRRQIERLLRSIAT